MLSEYLPIEMVVFFREPLSFLDSLYRQYLKNPKLPSISPYGKDLSFAQMYEIPWFHQHLDYLGFIQECRQLFGQKGIHPVKFDKSTNIEGEFCKILKIPTDRMERLDRKNRAQSSGTVEILRIVNRYDLTITEKQQALNILHQLDSLLSKHSEKINYAATLHEKIMNKMRFQLEVLKKYYGIDWDFPLQAE